MTVNKGLNSNYVSAVDEGSDRFYSSVSRQTEPREKTMTRAITNDQGGHGI